MTVTHEKVSHKTVIVVIFCTRKTVDQQGAIFDRQTRGGGAPHGGPFRHMQGAGGTHQTVTHKTVTHKTVTHETVTHETVTHKTVTHETVTHKTVAHKTVTHETFNSVTCGPHKTVKAEFWPGRSCKSPDFVSSWSLVARQRILPLSSHWRTLSSGPPPCNS
jgi:hypothetical protein